MWVCCPKEEEEGENDIINRYGSFLPEPPNCGHCATDKIFGGTEAELDEFPWIVQLGYRKRKIIRNPKHYQNFHTT